MGIIIILQAEGEVTELNIFYFLIRLKLVDARHGGGLKEGVMAISTTLLLLLLEGRRTM
jgi:hypothetical protein